LVRKFKNKYRKLPATLQRFCRNRLKSRFKMSTTITKKRKHKTKSIDKECCILCANQVENHSNLLQRDAFDKWKHQCCLTLCKLLQLESLNNGYNFLLSNGKFCKNCIGIVRELEMSIREIDWLEKNILKSIDTVKNRLNKGKNGNQNTEEKINQIMTEMEQTEEQNLDKWYSKDKLLGSTICAILNSSK